MRNGTSRFEINRADLTREREGNNVLRIAAMPLPLDLTQTAGVVFSDRRIDLTRCTAA
jgi:hypothetical protein